MTTKTPRKGDVIAANEFAKKERDFQEPRYQFSKSRIAILTMIETLARKAFLAGVKHSNDIHEKGSK